MASGEARGLCVLCQQYPVLVTCSGCNKPLCNRCYEKHKQELADSLKHVLEENAKLSREIQNSSGMAHEWIQNVEKWKKDSMERIEKAARDAIEHLRIGLETASNELLENCQDLNDRLQLSINEKSYTDLEVDLFKQDMARYQNEQVHPSNIEIINDVNDSSDTIKLIRVTVRHSKPLLPPKIDKYSRWKLNGQTIIEKHNQTEANGKIELESPSSIDIDLNDGTIYVSDQQRHQILARRANSDWKVVAGGRGRGSQLNQLDQPTAVVIDYKNNSLIIADWGNRRVLRWPLQTDPKVQIIASNIVCTGLAIDKHDNVYVSDYKNSNVQQCQPNGAVRIIAGDRVKGNAINQLNGPTHLFIDGESSLYISDTKNNRVVKYLKNATEGIVLANGLDTPTGLFVDSEESLYVVDQGHHCVMRWLKDEKGGTVVVGTKKSGTGENELSRPTGLCFDQKGNLYVTDLQNHRVQMFDIEEETTSS